MEISDKGLGLLRTWEGYKNHRYVDSAGYPSIGVGHKILPQEAARGVIYINRIGVPYANGLTDKQVLALLHQDLRPAESAVNLCVKVHLTQNQFDALVAFTFNEGDHAFATSTLVKLLNQGDYNSVPDQLRRWVTAHGVKLQGLVNRRENEVKLWLGQL